MAQVVEGIMDRTYRQVSVPYSRLIVGLVLCTVLEYSSREYHYRSPVHLKVSNFRSLSLARE